MGHEEVVLQGLSVEAPRLTAPAALRARLARLAGLAVPPTRPRRLEEPEHLGFALAPHRADQGVSTRIDCGRTGQIRAVEAFQERNVAGTLSFITSRLARADDGPELVQRGPREEVHARRPIASALAEGERVRRCVPPQEGPEPLQMEHRVVLDRREPVETASRRGPLDGGADREPGPRA